MPWRDGDDVGGSTRSLRLPIVEPDLGSCAQRFADLGVRTMPREKHCLQESSARSEFSVNGEYEFVRSSRGKEQ
jgi:hypothetical protein